MNEEQAIACHYGLHTACLVFTIILGLCAAHVGRDVAFQVQDDVQYQGSQIAPLEHTIPADN